MEHILSSKVINKFNHGTLRITDVLGRSEHSTLLNLENGTFFSHFVVATVFYFSFTGI